MPTKTKISEDCLLNRIVGVVSWLGCNNGFQHLRDGFSCNIGVFMKHMGAIRIAMCKLVFLSRAFFCDNS